MKRIDRRIAALEQAIKKRPRESQITWVDIVREMTKADGIKETEATEKPEKMTWDDVVDQMLERRERSDAEEAN